MLLAVPICRSADGLAVTTFLLHNNEFLALIASPDTYFTVLPAIMFIIMYLRCVLNYLGTGAGVAQVLLQLYVNRRLPA